MDEDQRVRVYQALQYLISQNSIVNFTQDNLNVTSINVTNSINLFFKDSFTENLFCRISCINWEKYSKGLIDCNTFYLISEELLGNIKMRSQNREEPREFRITVKIKIKGDKPCIAGVWMQPIKIWYVAFDLNPIGMNTKATR